MTRRTLQRGFTLVEIVAALPVLLALTITGYCLVNNIEDLHSGQAVRHQEDARIRDLVRRVQEDAARATEATLEDAQAGRQLSLRLPSGNVTYTAAPGGVTRTEASAGAPPTRYAWALDRTQMDYQLETVGQGSRVVWIRCTIQLPHDKGPSLARQLSAAAVVGRGGAR